MDTSIKDRATESQHPEISKRRNNSLQADIIVICVVLILFLAMVAFPAPLLQAPRALLGLTYILCLPGYALTVALYPYKDDLKRIERIALSLGLSVVLVVVLAWIVDRLPWGIELWPVLTAEAVTILFLSVIAWQRRAGIAPGEDFRPTMTPPQIRVPILVGLGGVILLLLSALAMHLFSLPAPAETMTEFYILGQPQLAQSYPQAFPVDQTVTSIVGIHNLEGEVADYRVEVWAEDPWHEERRQLLDRLHLTLAANERSVKTVRWSMPWSGADQKIIFLLFLNDQREPYRELQLRVDTIQPEG